MPSDFETDRSIAQFDEWAGHYDEGIWSIYFRRAYQRALDVLKRNVLAPTRVLDLGCGTGGLTHLMASSGFGDRLYGLDFSPTMLEVAKQGGTERETFILGDASKIPFDDGDLDAVVCLNSFHHYPDQQLVVSEVSRCLAPGGVFVLLDPVTDGWVRHLWCLLLRRGFGEPDVRYLSSASVDSMFSSAGLTVAETTNFMYFTRFTVGTRLAAGTSYEKTPA